MEFMFGEENIPNSNPTMARIATMIECGVSGPRNANPATTAIPMVAGIRGSTRSEILPEKMTATVITTGWVMRMMPAKSG